VRLFLSALLLAYCAAAAAQLRTIPADAKRGSMRHLQDMTVEIDGTTRARLAPGAQIRSASNTVVVPTALPPDSLVKYQVDEAGMVKQVWILTPQEAEKP